MCERDHREGAELKYVGIVRVRNGRHADVLRTAMDLELRNEAVKLDRGRPRKPEEVELIAGGERPFDAEVQRIDGTVGRVLLEAQRGSLEKRLGIERRCGNAEISAIDVKGENLAASLALEEADLALAETELSRQRDLVQQGTIARTEFVP